MDKINSLPKPLVIGITVVLVLLATVIAYRTVKSGGANDSYGTKKEIMDAQKNGHSHNMPPKDR